MSRSPYPNERTPAIGSSESCREPTFIDLPAELQRMQNRHCPAESGVLRCCNIAAPELKMPLGSFVNLREQLVVIEDLY